jgi:hypothetical protein
VRYQRDWPHDVYVILDANNDRVKIGHSAVPTRRLRTLQSACSEPLLLSLTYGIITYSGYAQPKTEQITVNIKLRCIDTPHNKFNGEEVCGGVGLQHLYGHWYRASHRALV